MILKKWTHIWHLKMFLVRIFLGVGIWVDTWQAWLVMRKYYQRNYYLTSINVKFYSKHLTMNIFWQEYIRAKIGLNGFGVFFGFYVEVTVFAVIFFLFRFQGFCVSIMLISLAFTTFQKFLHKKKKQNQAIPILTERPSSVGTSVGLQLNVVSENDQMISSNTVVIFSSLSFSFFTIWTFYSSSTAGFVYYNLLIVFFLVFNITPPLYFFNNLSKFKIAISIIHEMFS